MEQQKRCTICNLPQGYPGLSLDEAGVCNLCRKSTAEAPYPGLDGLKARVAKILGKPQAADRPYDAAVAFSGGRDSSYLVHFAKHVLGLKVLAVTLVHDFMPAETLESISSICKLLDVDWHVITNKALNEGSLQCVKAWARKPDAATLVTFCTGCRYGIKRLIPQYCKEQGIPLLLVGNTRMEQMTYRQDLLATDQRHPTTVNKAVGYLRAIARNPAMLGSPSCACVQAYEFGYPLARRIIKNKHVTVLAPFRDDVYISDEERTAVLNEIGWQHHASFKSQWRADCYVNSIRQYFYQEMLGFNDLDVHYAEKLRYGLISKEEAMAKLQSENNFDPQMIAWVLQKHYGLDLQEILQKIRK